MNGCADVEAAWYAAIDALVAAAAGLGSASPLAAEAVDVAEELRLIKLDQVRRMPRCGNQAAGHWSSSSDAGSSDYGDSRMWSD